MFKGFSEDVAAAVYGGFSAFLHSVEACHPFASMCEAACPEIPVFVAPVHQVERVMGE